MATPTPAATAGTTFQGTLAGVGSAGQSGTVTVAVATVISATTLRPLTVSTATGSIHIAGGGTTSVTGTYDSATNAVSVSGGGFSLTGTVSSGVLSGNYTQSNAAGGFSTVNTGSGTVTTFCGAYTSTVPFADQFGVPGIYQEAGAWNVQIASNGNASGESIPTSYSYSGNAGGPKPAAAPNFLTGQLAGSTLTLKSNEGGTATVTVSGSSVSGSAVSPSGKGSGTFNGSTSACQ